MEATSAVHLDSEAEEPIARLGTTTTMLRLIPLRQETIREDWPRRNRSSRRLSAALQQWNLPPAPPGNAADV